MIFNEYGEIVTIESKYRSIDEWLQESYKIEEYLNEGKIAAGIEKAIRWIIDGFMHVVDILKNISNSKAIKFVKQHKKEIIDKIINYFPLEYSSSGDWTNSLYNFDNLSCINFKKFDQVCKDPTNYQDIGYDELSKEIAPFAIKAIKKQDIPAVITNALDVITDNTKLSNDIRRSISSLKVLSKGSDIDRQFIQDIVKLGKSIISHMQRSIKSCLSFIQKAMNGEFDKDWKHGQAEYDKKAAREQESERDRREAERAFYQGLRSNREELNKEINNLVSAIKDADEKNPGLLDDISKILEDL